MKSMLTALGVATLIAMPAAAQDFGPPELIAAAKKEGRLVYYTANFAEVEQEVIRAFNKRFPEIKVEMVRAPVYPEGFDPKVVKVWLPDFDQYVKLHASWVEEWNKIYGYRQ